MRLRSTRPSRCCSGVRSVAEGMLYRSGPARAAGTVSLASLLEHSGLPDLGVSGIQSDSRQISPGDLFCAYPGARHDGREHIPSALAAGAAAVFCEPPLPEGLVSGSVPVIAVPGLAQALGTIAARFYGQPSEDLCLYGVTGTNGKTTVSRLLAQCLHRLGGHCGVIGTLGAELLGAAVSAAAGSPGSALTTPDAITLQRQLAAWRDEGVRQATLEVSSHALVQGRVNGMHFDCAIFTNLSRDHLDYHGSMAAYAQAKARLFGMPGLRAAVLNGDDPHCAQMRAGLTPGVPCLIYSRCESGRGDAEADVRIHLRAHTAGGEHLQLHTPWGEGEFHTPLVGAFNRSNLAAVASAVLLMGAPLPTLLAALGELTPVPGRLQPVANRLGLRVLVDFAHTPDALEQVLRTLREATSGALHVVFGCGGDRDTGKRAPMGALASALADHVYLTSDNPRSEDPESIIDQIAAGCTGAVWRDADRASAIAHAINGAAAGDCVLIAGKGHETTQHSGGSVLHFSDVEQAAAALRAREASA